MALRRSAGTCLAVSAGGVLLGARFVPSTLVLAQWLPDDRWDPRALPGICRWRGPHSVRRQIALTFDDGPELASTPSLLRVLERLGLKATFFCLGSAVRRAPGLVREIVDRGHEIALHGDRHARHVFRSSSWVARDLEEGLEALLTLGTRPVFLRPPYGIVSGATLRSARGLGLELVLWSAWGREWADDDTDSIARRVSRRLRPGAVVLLHDSDEHAPTGTAWRARQVVEMLAPVLEERQLEAVTLSELVEP